MNLSGKDFLTIPEAAHYACVCERQFRNIAKERGIQSFPWGGKKVYRKEDIKAAMEREWLASSNAGASGGSLGSPLRVGAASLQAQQTKGKRNYSGGPRS